MEIGGETGPLSAALKRAQALVAGFGSGIAQVGKAAFTGLAAATGAALGGIIASASHFASAGSEIADASARTDASAENLSALGFAAKQTGTDLGTVEGSFRKMQKTIGEASSGSKQAADALAQIGISAADLQGLNPDEQFDKIGRAVAGVSDSTQRAAIAMEIFGKSGTSIIPLLSDMDALKAQAQALGVVLTNDQANAADALGDSWDALGSAIGGVENVIGSAVAGPLTQMISTVTNLVIGMGQWVSQSDALQATFAALATGFDFIATRGSESIGIITDAFSGVGGFVQSYIMPVFSTLWSSFIDGVAAIAFATTNFGSVWESVWSGALLGVVTFANQAVYFFSEVIPTWLSWFADNWYDVFTDVYNFTATIFDNIGKNIYNFFQAVVKYFNGDGFDFKWTGLTEGFRSAIKELPKIADRAIGPLEKSLQEQFDKATTKIGQEYGDFKNAFQQDAQATTPVANRFDVSQVRARSQAEQVETAINAAADTIKQFSSGSFSAAAASGLGAGGSKLVSAIDQARKEQVGKLDDIRRLMGVLVQRGAVI